MGLKKSVPISEVPPLARLWTYYEIEKQSSYEKCIAYTHNLFVDYKQCIYMHYTLHIKEDNSLKKWFFIYTECIKNSPGML